MFSSQNFKKNLTLLLYWLHWYFRLTWALIRHNILQLKLVSLLIERDLDCCWAHGWVKIPNCFFVRRRVIYKRHGSKLLSVQVISQNFYPFSDVEHRLTDTKLKKKNPAESQVCLQPTHSLLSFFFSYSAVTHLKLHTKQVFIISWS